MPTKKIKPLATNQQVLTWLNVCPAEETATKREKNIYVAISMAVFFFAICFLIGSLLFFKKHWTNNLEEAFLAFNQFFSMLGFIYMIVVAYTLRQKITEIFGSLAEIYNAHENEDSYRLLARVDNTTEWMWQMYFKYVLKGYVVSFTLVTVVSVLICYVIRGTFDTEYVFHAVKLTWPWNNEYPIFGYICETLFCLILGEIYFPFNGAILLLFISLCLHHRAFYLMFRYLTHKLNSADEIRNKKEHIHKLIDFHNTVKSFFLKTSEVYSLFVMIQLICNMVLLAGTVFQLDLQTKHLDSHFYTMLIFLSVGISNLFVFCYFGKLASESFAKMSNSLYEVNWHELPIKLQKYFIMMIQNAQRPLFYHGFGVAVLNLETFTDLMRAVYTYYMALKTLANQ